MLLKESALSNFVRASVEDKQGVYKGVMEKSSQRQAQTLLEGEEDHPVCGDDQSLDFLG